HRTDRRAEANRQQWTRVRVIKADLGPNRQRVQGDVDTGDLQVTPDERLPWPLLCRSLPRTHGLAPLRDARERGEGRFWDRVRGGHDVADIHRLPNRLARNRVSTVEPENLTERRWRRHIHIRAR